MGFKKTILTGACVLAVSIFILSTPSCEREEEEIEEPVTEETIETPVPTTSVSIDPTAGGASITILNETAQPTVIDFVGYYIPGEEEQVVLDDMNRRTWPQDRFEPAFDGFVEDPEFSIALGKNESVSFEVAAPGISEIMIFQSMAFVDAPEEYYPGTTGTWYYIDLELEGWMFNVDVEQIFTSPQNNFEIVVKGDWTEHGDPYIRTPGGIPGDWSLEPASYDGTDTTFVFSGKGLTKGEWAHFGIQSDYGSCNIKNMYWTYTPPVLKE